MDRSSCPILKPSGDFFFPDPRSGDGFECEDEEDGDGGLAATPVYNVKSEDSDAGGGLAASESELWRREDGRQQSRFKLILGKSDTEE